MTTLLDEVFDIKKVTEKYWNPLKYSFCVNTTTILKHVTEWDSDDTDYIPRNEGNFSDAQMLTVLFQGNFVSGTDVSIYFSADAKSIKVTVADTSHNFEFATASGQRIEYIKNSIHNILVEGGMYIPLDSLITESLTNYPDKGGTRR